MTEGTGTVAPVGGGSAGGTGTATTKVLTIANEAVANFLKMMGAAITKDGDKYTITVSNDDGIDLGDGLTKDELTKLGINFTNNRLFDLIDAGTVIGGTNTDKTIDANDAAKFMTNVEEYAKLLGYNITDTNRDQVLKDVAAMYDRSGVDFREVTEADQVAVKAAADALKGKTPGATAYATWNADDMRTLENTKLLACEVLGATDDDGGKLVNDLVNAWWTKVMGKSEGEQISADDLPKLYSFLSFWRNVPDEVLKGWGVTPKQLETCALNSGNNVTVVDSNKWTTWLTPAAQPQAAQGAQTTPPTTPPPAATPVTEAQANAYITGLGFNKDDEPGKSLYGWLMDPNNSGLIPDDVRSFKPGEIADLIPLIKAAVASGKAFPTGATTVNELLECFPVDSPIRNVFAQLVYYDPTITWDGKETEDYTAESTSIGENGKKVDIPAEKLDQLLQNAAKLYYLAQCQGWIGENFSSLTGTWKAISPLWDTTNNTAPSLTQIK